MPPPGPTDDLAITKLRAEVEKLTEEVGKLREDRRWYNRHLAVIGALCGVAATFLVGFGQFQSNTSRNDFEIQRGEIDSRLKLLEFAVNQRDKVLAGDADAQIRYLRVLKASLPAREAKLILDAFAGAATRAEVLDELQKLGADIPIRTVVVATAPPPARVESAPPRTQATPTGPSASAPPLPTPPLSSPPVSPVPPVAPPPVPIPAGTRLALYAHIARDSDRPAATQAAAAAGDAFPLAGVEYVASWGARPRTRGEIRYYKRDQMPIAEALAVRLGQETGLAFVTVPLYQTYPNLPANRIEVWFPQFPDR